MAGYRSGLSGATKGLRKINTQIKRQARFDATILSKEAKGTKNKATGKFKSNITGKLYETRQEAIRAGRISQGWAKRRRDNGNSLYEKTFSEKQRKLNFNEELKKERKEFRETAKSLGYDKNTTNGLLKTLGRDIDMIKAMRENLSGPEVEDDFDEDEWEEVDNPTPERPREDDVWVYWEQVSHGLIGNSFYYLHTSGSWLYDHGFDGWNLADLVQDTNYVSADNHTNLDFIDQAIKDSGIPYEVVYNEDGEPYISRKNF